jgi:hypothetical protein
LCTLIALVRQVPGLPLVVAANRDEFYDRPAEGPALRRTPQVAIVAPRDARAGGTWLGLNQHGVFAALTNRRGGELDPGRRSRGLLVIEALAGRSALEAARRIEDRTLRSGTYNPFNLLLADREHAFALGGGDHAERLRLEPGVHVIGSEPLSGGSSAKLDAVGESARRLLRERSGRLLEGLAAICRAHAVPGSDPLASPCVHTPAFGTRSSLLLQLAEEPGRRVLRYAEGAPCATPYRDFTPLLHELGREPARSEGDSPRSVH